MKMIAVEICSCDTIFCGVGTPGGKPLLEVQEQMAFVSSASHVLGFCSTLMRLKTL